MTPTALVLLLQTVSATPTPAPALSPTPAPKKTPVAAAGYGTGRSLSDVARERKLQKEKGEEAPMPRGFTLAPAAGGIGGGAKQPAEADAASEPDAPAWSRTVVVESAQHNDQVAANGQVRVYGTVRNMGASPACAVVVTVRLYDDKERYLVSGGGPIDEPRLQPGGRSSYSVYLQAPQGVAGTGKQKSLGYGTSGGGVTLEGSWRTLGRAEAEITSVAEACPGEKPASKPAEDASGGAPTPPPG